MLNEAWKHHLRPRGILQKWTGFHLKAGQGVVIPPDVLHGAINITPCVSMNMYYSSLTHFPPQLRQSLLLLDTVVAPTATPVATFGPNVRLVVELCIKDWQDRVLKYAALRGLVETAISPVTVTNLMAWNCLDSEVMALWAEGRDLEDLCYLCRFKAVPNFSKEVMVHLLDGTNPDHTFRRKRSKHNSVRSSELHG